MKFYYGQNHTVIQTIKHKQTGASNRFVVCKFDDKGEFETNDPRIIHILQTQLTGCTWEGEEVVKKEEVKEILSDEELRSLAKEKGIKNWHNKKIENILKELED